MYLAYVREAEKQWSLIKRYKAQLSLPGIEYGETVCSNAEIDLKIQEFSEVKGELEQQGVQVATVKWMDTNLRYIGPGSKDRSTPGTSNDRGSQKTLPKKRKLEADQAPKTLKFSRGSTMSRCGWKQTDNGSSRPPCHRLYSQRHDDHNSTHT